MDESARGIGLLVPAPLPLGTPVKVEARNELLLGDVCYSAPQDNLYRVGVVIKHRLRGLAQLHNLNRALVADTPNDVPSDSPIMKR